MLGIDLLLDLVYAGAARWWCSRESGWRRTSLRSRRVSCVAKSTRSRRSGALPFSLLPLPLRNVSAPSSSCTKPHRNQRQPQAGRCVVVVSSPPFLGLSLPSSQHQRGAMTIPPPISTPQCTRLLALPPPILTTLIAHLLSTCARANDLLPTRGPITRFHAKVKPPLRIADYLSRCAAPLLLAISR